MNVLVLTSSFPSYIGDFAGNFVYELSKRLKERGFIVTILCPHLPNAKFKEEMCGLSVYRFPYFYPFSYQKIYSEEDIVYNLRRSYLARFQIPFFFLSQLFHAMKIIRKEKIDLIHSHWIIPSGLIGAICRKIFRIPHITTIHSSDVTLMKKAPIGMEMTEFILKNSEMIISVSLHRINELLSFISSKISESVKNRIQIIPMGVDLSEFRNKTNKQELKIKYDISSKFIVLFVGRLVEVKGCEYLIKSFKSVLCTFRDVLLIIIGGGYLESELIKTVKYLKINEYVRFEGFVEHYKVSDYHSLSDVVVFPSIVDSSGFKEGFAVSLLEALAAGKPIVATRTEGFLEAIEDGWNGFLVEPESPEGITDKVLKLLKSEELRNKFSENALETSKKYDWNVIAGKYLEIFRNMNLK